MLPRMTELEGRDVVITGGAGALGASVVAAFQRAGAIVHLPIRGGAFGAPAKPGTFIYPAVDLADEASVRAFYEALPRPPWASVHLAGGFAMAPLTETSLADFRGQLDLNLVTAFLCCREAVRAFRRRPGGGGGRLVNVASRAALQPGGGAAGYSASKAALVSLTQTLAVELAAEKILVNAVAPGTMDTPANRAGARPEQVARFTPTDDVAAVLLWLASPANTIASGSVVPVFGVS